MTGTATSSPPLNVVDDAYGRQTPAQRLLKALSFQNISAAYVLIGFIILFGLWVPDAFLSTTTFRTLLYSQAVTAIVAIGLIIPLSAGVYDLSIGGMMGAASVTAGYLMVERQTPVLLAVAITFGVGLLVGVFNGLLVVVAKIDSLIATLATSSILLAYGSFVSGDQVFTGLPESFQAFGVEEIAGITLPVLYLVGIGLIFWFALEHLPIGRYIYATGGGKEAARLAGIPTGKIIFGTLVVSALVATFAGLVASARGSTGQFQLGPPYLLPAFAAVFLGATQLKQGRFNVWGTILAVYVLAVGVKGLQVAGAPLWLPDLFNGLALALAVGLSSYRGRPRVAGRRRWFGRGKTSTDPPDQPSGPGGPPGPGAADPVPDRTRDPGPDPVSDRQPPVDPTTSRPADSLDSKPATDAARPGTGGESRVV